MACGAARMKIASTMYTRISSETNTAMRLIVKRASIAIANNDLVFMVQL